MVVIPLLIALGFVLVSGSAQAEIYKYVDENGHVTFSDVYRKGAKRVDVPGAPARAQSGATRASVRVPTPGDFPRIDPATQKRRDDIRRQVLEDEIAAERRNVEEARRQLALGEKLLPGERTSDTGYQARVQRLREVVAQHEQNIAAIQRELARVR